MLIDNNFIKESINIKSDIAFKCENLGLVYHTQPKLLSFLDDLRFLTQLKQNSNIDAAFIKADFLPDLMDSPIVPLICDEPRFWFYKLSNYIVESHAEFKPSRIHPKALIHPKAYVAENNVDIDENVVVGPNVTILANVSIGEGSIIQAGTVIGSEGFEYKRTKYGIISVKHGGIINIGNRVEIGANCAIDKPVFTWDKTLIGDDTKIDNLVHIAHSDKIGNRCFITAGTIFSGEVMIKDDVWLGPNSCVANQITILNKAFITIGSVVTKDVGMEAHVTGNFAIDHDKFLKFLKSIR